jgi:DNA-binding transcriptional MerR regulator
VEIVSSRRSGLVALGEGVYTVAEISRIFQPTMTPRKVHYWLKKGIIGQPVRPGAPGRSALLSFEQLLMVRTVQHLREKLNFSLQKITPAIQKLSSFVFQRLFDEEWYQLRFVKTPEGHIGVIDSMNRSVEVDTGQFVMPEVLSELEAFLNKTREDWERREHDQRREDRVGPQSC